MRRYLQRWKENKGFSLVELMVAVGIIGVMSTIAVPRYQEFRAKAAQAEAQATLSSIYTLQQLYFTENDEYATAATVALLKSKLNYQVSTGALYDYATTAKTPDKVSFHATAVSKKKLASCTVSTASDGKDKWCINQDKVLTNGNEINYAHKPATHGPCAPADIQNGGCSSVKDPKP